MKITFLMVSSGFSGGARVVSIYAERLQQRGHDVLVVSTPPRQPDLKQQIRSLIKHQRLVSAVKHEPTYFDHLNIPYKVIDCWRPMTDSDVPDADVVIATWWETAEWAASLSESKGAKVHFIQGHEVFEYLNQSRVAASYLLPLYKLTISQNLVEILRTHYHVKNYSLVSNSVDLRQFYAPVRSKQQIPTIGLVYTPDIYWKGCDIGLQAYQLALHHVPNLRLVAFGHQRPDLTDLPLPPGTEYGYQLPQAQLKDFYAKCDAWLFSSRAEEGFGLPILEAMACRTPVIGTSAGAAPELLSDGAGILVKSEDPHDLAEAIVSLCRFSDDEWRAMSEAAYAKATSYTWDDATEQFEQALLRAIARSD